MISQLRKRHLTIWMALAVLLPIGFIAAILSIPTPATMAQLASSVPPALPTVLASGETPELKLNRRTANQPDQQLEVIIKQPLTHASALVYLSEEGKAMGKRPGTLLGRLGSKGVYRFAVPAVLSTEKTWKVILYDALKDQRIQTILLQP
jgi:hypothetical protein